MRIIKILSICMVVFTTCFLLSACSDDPSNEMMDNNQESNTGFSINSNLYETPNAYLIYKYTNQYDLETMMDVEKILNRFSFSFTNGSAIVNDGDVLYSIDTEHESFHHFRDFDDNVTVLDDIKEVKIEAKTYTQSPSTTSRIGISNIDVLETSGDGNSYGDIRLLGTNYVLTENDVATFKINSIDINYEDMTGTIDCEYSVSPSWEGPITGKYIGSFDILIE